MVIYLLNLFIHITQKYSQGQKVHIMIDDVPRYPIKRYFMSERLSHSFQSCLSQSDSTCPGQVNLSYLDFQINIKQQIQLSVPYCHPTIFHQGNQ